MWHYGPTFDFPIQGHVTILHLFKGGKTNVKKSVNEDYSVHTGLMHVLLRLLYLLINLEIIINMKLLKICKQNWS